MGALVKGHPEPEFVGPELVAALHLQHVGTDEQDCVAVAPVRGREHELVLTEYPPRQQPEHCAHLDRDDAASDPRSDATLTSELPLGGCEQRRETGDVVLDPLASRHHCDFRGPGGAQSGLGLDQLGRALDHRRSLGGVSGLVIRALQRIRARHATGYATRQPPIEGGGRHLRRVPRARE